MAESLIKNYKETLIKNISLVLTGCPRGLKDLKSLKFCCIKFKALKSLKLYKKVLIMISRGLKFGDGKTRIAIWLNVTIKLQKAMISLNKHERCTFKVFCLYRENRYISAKGDTCWQRMNQLTG